MVLVTDKAGDARFREQAAAMNQELMLSVVRQHELTETLGVSELRYRNIFESAKDGILLLDADGRVYDANPSFIEMLGYSREELAGKTLWDIGPIKDIEPRRAHLRNC